MNAPERLAANGVLNIAINRASHLRRSLFALLSDIGMVEVNKKEGESISSLIYRFSRRVQQSGVIIEVRRRRFRDREPNKRRRRASAQHRAEKQVEFIRKKKLGVLK